MRINMNATQVRDRRVQSQLWHNETLVSPMTAKATLEQGSGRRGLLGSSLFRTALLLSYDGAAATLCLWLALLLRFEGHIREGFAGHLPAYIALLVVARSASNLLLKLDRWSFRFSGLTDGMRIGIAGLLGTGTFLAGAFLFQVPMPPRSVVVLEFFLTTTAMAVARFSPRLGWMYLADRTRTRRNGTQRTIIVGAGAGGEMLLRDLQRSSEHRYKIVAFVDDDRSKQGMIVGGKTGAGRDRRPAGRWRSGTTWRTCSSPSRACPRSASARSSRCAPISS